ncbi:MAG: DUF2628 domain-containing protein [Ruminococcus sp.]|nr:DUF2628 domain-containing protein [Ruminococcus sp.]
MNFIGEKCVYCGQVFTDGDDVVVCPECGSPHHRECYKKENRCANSSLHGTGEKWTRIETEEKTETIECPSCKFPNNPIDVKNCMVCGAELDGEESHETGTFGDEGINLNHSAGFNPDEDMGGATLREISMFVGTNTFYYIPIFKRMKDIGSKISFNFSCFIFPSFYFANRKMWLWAIIYTLISVILNLPASVMIMADNGVFTENMLNIIYENQSFIESLESICGWGSWILRLLLCLFANWIYFKFSLKNLKRIKMHSRNENLNLNLVMALGGVKPMNIIIVTLITLALSLVSMVGITMFLNMMAIV